MEKVLDLVEPLELQKGWLLVFHQILYKPDSFPRDKHSSLFWNGFSEKGKFNITRAYLKGTWFYTQILDLAKILGTKVLAYSAEYH